MDITDEPDEVLAAIGPMLGLDPAQAAESPYLAVGTADAIAEKITTQSKQLGIDRWVVMDNDVEALEPVLAQL